MCQASLKLLFDHPSIKTLLFFIDQPNEKKRMIFVLLHGLGCHPITLKPVEFYLRYHLGVQEIHNLYYPADKLTFDESLNYVDEEMSKVIKGDKANTPIVVIGQSMGGVIANNLHKKGWNIKKGIYIGSPLHGAKILNHPLSGLFLTDKPLYHFLKHKDREKEPPHDYHTISMGWFCSNFDGCVYRDETTLDESKHTHLPWADHRTVFVNPRLFMHIGHILSDVFD